MLEVDVDAWAVFISRYHFICLLTEDTMKVWDLPSRQALSVVETLPNGSMRYWINTETKAERRNVNTIV